MPHEVHQLLQGLDARPTVAAYTQAARDVRALAPRLKPARIAQLSTFTIEPLAPYLEVEAARLGFAVETYHGPFNAIRQELLDPRSGCAAHAADVVFVSHLLEDVCPPLMLDFLDLAPSDVEDLIERTVDDFVGTVKSFRDRSNAAIVVTNFPLPPFAELGIYEATAPNGQTAAIRRLNHELTQKLTAISGVHLLDLDRLCAGIGYQQWRHEEMWYSGRSPLSSAALTALARTQAAFLQALLGTPRKCLVLDLDNTLWGGVIGEDGLGGIQLGHTYPGNVFRDVQQAALQLYRRGVLLAINSKNNAADVEEAFRSHPDMLLKREHFAAMRINWNPKPQNMLELAEELNIGVDSLVFLDDSPAECALMRQSLPQVLTWEGFNVDGRPDPIRAKTQILSSRVFDKLSFTADDRRRGEMYREQAARRQLEQSVTSLDDFLVSLNMTAEIAEVDEFSFTRALDLLHKTNQFNLTTRRHTETRLRVMVDDAAWGVFTIRVLDKFGDNGIVGLAIARVEQEVAEIDSFLLSCRVIGRKVETALLSHLVDWAKQHGAEYLQGSFYPTAKNAPAAKFYADHGFMQVERDGDGTRWLLTLDAVPFARPSFIGRVGEQADASDVKNDDRLLKLIANVLNVKQAELTDESSPTTLPAWDSLNHLNLVLAIESEYEISLAPQDAMAMQSVGEIRRVLTRDPSEATTSAITFADCTDEQIPEFKEFIARSYNPNYVLGVNDAYFQWQYGVLAKRPGKYRIRLAMVEGKIAGCMGYIPLEIDVAGKSYPGAWLANWMVDPEHRKSGLGPLLAREITRDHQITLALGANEEARDILARMGWRDFDMLRRYVCVLDVAGAAVLTSSGKLDWPQATKSTEVDTSSVALVERFTSDAEQLWDRLRGGDATVAGTRRTVEFLNWRYAEHPQFPYRLFEARRDGKLQGFAVYRVEQARDATVRVGRIVELVGEADVEDSLLAAMQDDARRHEAVAMDFFCGSECFAGLLSRHGFLPGDDARAQQIPVLYQPIDRRRAGIRFLADLSKIPEAAGVQTWYVVKSDGDQDRPN